MEGNITLNLSGTKFEISKNVFKEMTKIDTNARRYFEKRDKTLSFSEIFLERSPVSFSAILSFYQGHGLHLPSTICIAEFKSELEFWGIDADIMEHCCYSKYVGFLDDQKILTLLENDQNQRIDDRKDIKRRIREEGWISNQAKVWSALEEPSFSLIAKVYFYISAVFVIVSIIALVCGTHPTFKRSLKESEWREYFGEDYYLYAGHFDSSLITTNTTLPPLPSKVRTHLDFLVYLEYITVTFFSVEFVLRVIFCPSKKRFFLSFLNLVDIFALAVMYSKYIANAINPKEKYTASILDIIHCLQIVRVFRLFRLVKNFIGFRVLLYSVKASFYEVLLMSMFLVVAMLMFSAFVFFSGDTVFTSIPDAFWWSIVTMTTVGYGDIYPTLPLSKTIGAVCAVTGVCLLAVIIPIFVNNFLLFYSYSKVWGGKDISKDDDNGSCKHTKVKMSTTKIIPIQSKNGDLAYENIT